MTFRLNDENFPAFVKEYTRFIRGVIFRMNLTKEQIALNIDDYVLESFCYLWKRREDGFPENVSVRTCVANHTRETVYKMIIAERAWKRGGGGHTTKGKTRVYAKDSEWFDKHDHLHSQPPYDTIAFTDLTSRLSEEHFNTLELLLKGLNVTERSALLNIGYSNANERAHCVRKVVRRLLNGDKMNPNGLGRKYKAAGRTYSDPMWEEYFKTSLQTVPLNGNAFDHAKRNRENRKDYPWYREQRQMISWQRDRKNIIGLKSKWKRINDAATNTTV